MGWWNKHRDKKSRRDGRQRVKQPSWCKLRVPFYQRPLLGCAWLQNDKSEIHGRKLGRWLSFVPTGLRRIRTTPIPVETVGYYRQSLPGLRSISVPDLGRPYLLSTFSPLLSRRFGWMIRFEVEIGPVLLNPCWDIGGCGTVLRRGRTVQRLREIEELRMTGLDWFSGVG